MNTSQFYQNPKPSNEIYVGSGKDVFPKGPNGLPKGCFCLQPSNKYAAEFKNLPFNLSSSLISGSQSIDFQIISPGFVEELILDINITNTSGSAALNLCLPFCIDHVDFYSGSGSVMSQIYGESIFEQTLLMNYDESTRLLPGSGININTWNTVQIPASTTQQFYMRLGPNWIEAAKPRLSSLQGGPFRFRIYFSATNGGIDVPANCFVNACNVWSFGQIYSPEIENYQTQKLLSSVYRYIYPQAVRGLQVSQPLTANTTYQFQLSALTGLFSAIVFYLQPTPITSSNNRTLTAIQNVELHDSSNSLVGQNNTAQLMSSFQSTFWPGYILNNVNGLANYYTMNFGCGTAPLIFNQGCGCGICEMDGRWILQITTTSSMSSGTYQLSVWGWQYSLITSDRGNLYSSNSN